MDVIICDQLPRRISLSIFSHFLMKKNLDMPVYESAGSPMFRLWFIKCIVYQILSTHALLSFLLLII